MMKNKEPRVQGARSTLASSLELKEIGFPHNRRVKRTWASRDQGLVLVAGQ